MFDPEYKNLECPQCHLRKIYFDRDIGYYCMSCGQELSYDEVVMLIEKAEKTSQQIETSDKSEKKPPLEIKELPSPKAKEPKRTGYDATRHKPSEQD